MINIQLSIKFQGRARRSKQILFTKITTHVGTYLLSRKFIGIKIVNFILRMDFIVLREIFELWRHCPIINVYIALLH